MKKWYTRVLKHDNTYISSIENIIRYGFLNKYEICENIIYASVLLLFEFVLCILQYHALVIFLRFRPILLIELFFCILIQKKRKMLEKPGQWKKS